MPSPADEKESSGSSRPPYHLCVSKLKLPKDIKGQKRRKGKSCFKPCTICGNQFNIYAEEAPFRVNTSVLFATVPPPNPNKQREIKHEQLLRRYLIKRGYWKRSTTGSQDDSDKPSNGNPNEGSESQDTSIMASDQAAGDQLKTTDSESCIEVD